MTAMAMNPQENFMQLRIPSWTVAILAWLLVFFCGNWLLSEARPQQISRLQIEGDFKRVSARDIEARVRKRLGEGFVELGLTEVKTDIESMPWIARARVERVWPAGIRIRIWEREPFARWGNDALIDTQGQVFKPKPEEIPATLPMLAGIKGREREVMQVYGSMKSALESTPLALIGLSLDPRGEWSALTQSGIALRLGQSSPEGKIDSLRSVVLRTLTPRMSEVEYIDLRYTNGFAVGWKQQAKQKIETLGEQHG